MLNGALGADWKRLVRRRPLAPISARTSPSDPDALYTRLGTGLAFSASNPTQVDLGGPDGLGFYTRFNFANGRALVRVRYAPSDANVFSASPTGALPAAGRARSFVIIESVGRQGVVNPNDPTTLNAAPVQFTGFGSAAALQTALSQLADSEKSFPTSQKQIGFVSIGIIDDALYVTNKDRTSAPAYIGFSDETGAKIFSPGGVEFTVSAPTLIGGAQSMFTLSSPPIPVANVPSGGSAWVNTDLVLSGEVDLFENYTLGEGFSVAGNIIGADNASRLRIFRAEYEQNRPGFPAAWYADYPAIRPIPFSATFTGNQLNSRANLITYGGVLRDGVDGVDLAAFPRGARYKEPPSMELRDPTTGAMRYLTLTRESGSYVGNGNSGRFGHGGGVYVDNLDDFQMPRDDVARASVGSRSCTTGPTLTTGSRIRAGTGPFIPHSARTSSFFPMSCDRRDAPKGYSTIIEVP